MNPDIRVVELLAKNVSIVSRDVNFMGESSAKANEPLNEPD